MTVDEILQLVRDRNAVLYVEQGRLKYAGPRRAAEDPIRAAIDEHRVELIRLLTPTTVKGVIRVNPGMLMTFGNRYGYPRLPLSPGIAIAEGYRHWRAFTRSAPRGLLTLAAEAARATWSDDPMANDLYCVEHSTSEDDVPLGGCCTDARFCFDHINYVFEDDRDAHEGWHLEHGPAGRSA